MKNQHVGKIYRLTYPYTDAMDSKDRPVVIVIEELEDFEVLYITTQYSPGTIELEDSDFVDGSLGKKSYIKVSKSILFDKKFFTKETYMATLSIEKMKKIIKEIIAKYQILLAELESIS